METTCGRCKKTMTIRQYHEQYFVQICWVCQRTLCNNCMDKYGHCGHFEADCINESAVGQPNEVIMVADLDEDRILAELQILYYEIRAITLARDYLSTYYPANPTKYLKSIGCVLVKLQRASDRLESRLRIHRQKVEESGVKY